MKTTQPIWCRTSFPQITHQLLVLVRDSSISSFDRLWPTFSGGYIIAMVLFHLGGSSLVIFFSRILFRMSVQLGSKRPVDFRLLYDGTPSDGPPTFLGALHDTSMYLLMVMSFYSILFVMVGCSVFIIGHFFYSLRGYSIVRKVTTTITKRICALSRFAFRQFTPSNRHPSPLHTFASKHAVCCATSSRIRWNFNTLPRSR